MEKQKGKSAAKAFKHAFQENKKRSLFPSNQGLDKLHHFYSQYSEVGTHSTITAMGWRFRSEVSATEDQWRLEYLENDPKKIAVSLFSMLDASHEMEKACFGCLRERLDLDPELVKMRADFDRRKLQVRDALVSHFHLKPPAIQL